MPRLRLWLVYAEHINENDPYCCLLESKSGFQSEYAETDKGIFSDYFRPWRSERHKKINLLGGGLLTKGVRTLKDLDL